MANMQRLLGTMLATGMGGRSRRGMDFGTAALLGGSRGGGGFRQTAGLAALAYLAYRAFQERQQNAPAGPGGGAQTGGGGGGLGDLLGDLTGAGRRGQGTTTGGGPSLGERLGNILNPRPAEPPPEDAGMEDRQALVLIRAMIAAANADGQITPEERQRIVAKIDEAGADPDDHRVIERELSNPVPLDTLLREVNDPETAQQFYLASRVAIDGTTEVQRSYLQYLAHRLKLDPAQVDDVNRIPARAESYQSGS
jgi:uncharacterized membrane protein YebE (DUF533 family)